MLVLLPATYSLRAPYGVSLLCNIAHVPAYAGNATRSIQRSVGSVTSLRTHPSCTGRLLAMF